MVTNDIFVSFLHCKRKAFLLAAGTHGRPTDIETILVDLGHIYRQQALEAFCAPYREQDVLYDPPRLEVALKSSPQVIVNATASGDGLSSLIQAVERMKTTDPNGASVYTPVLFILNETVSRVDKLLLAYNSLALSSVQSVLPPIGKIVHGKSQKVLKCKIEPLVGEVRNLVAQIQAAQAEGAAPRVTLNRHCNICEFRADCQRLAEEADDLSLLRGMSEQDVEKQRGRGVTTVTQFAYTYRPGRRGKRKSGKARKHDHALQAVAIRDKKVYVLDSPTVPRSRVALYLDIEGVPDRGFDYLIGLVAVVDDCATTYCFWADDRTQEKSIWDACSRVINSFEDYTLYHYGQYELRYLDRMRRLTDEEGAATIDRIRARSCNMLAAIYSHIYFPTRYNGLKDVATFLGATWTAANASGIQSLAWRLAWETSGDETLKQRLLRYNQEDCLALRRVTEFVLSVCGDTVPADGPALSSAEDIQRQSGFRFKKQTFFCPELEHINLCAYSDYQREKVFFRTSSAVRKSLRRKQRARKKRLKVNQEMMFPSPEVCPECGAAELQKLHSTHARKIVADLKFTRSGVKRWCIRYTSARYRCLQCKNTFLAAGYRALKSHLGSKLSSWAIYHHVALRQSGRDVVLSLNDIFDFSFDRRILFQIIMLQTAEQYRTTYERLKDKLRQGLLIHADETKGAINEHSGYVWTFTNMEEVVYMFTPTREGIILDEMLDGFTGVLVSDFYAAYDSPKCPQQKCLIHLIRDINNDVFHNPFDEELKQLAQKFVGVLKPIIETIDRFGLKRYHLNKHKKDVARYFGYLSTQAFGSEVAKGYQKRMLRYRDKLFVFLDHDGIPWNNNNAENAIKPFASCRKIIQASFSERGLQDYLMFLSISQTCRNKNLSFLRFLLSGKQDIDVFADGAGR
ncbi:MAG: IS66 family transposase [Planctomycetia bacterium]|nr:IS66 family transposase [Planctomycetia bacterium]